MNLRFWLQGLIGRKQRLFRRKRTELFFRFELRSESLIHLFCILLSCSAFCSLRRVKPWVSGIGYHLSRLLSLNFSSRTSTSHVFILFVSISYHLLHQLHLSVSQFQHQDLKRHPPPLPLPLHPPYQYLPPDQSNCPRHRRIHACSLP